MSDSTRLRTNPQRGVSLSRSSKSGMWRLTARQPDNTTADLALTAGQAEFLKHMLTSWNDPIENPITITLESPDEVKPPTPEDSSANDDRPGECDMSPKPFPPNVTRPTTAPQRPRGTPMPEHRELAPDDDPFGALPYEQMTDALATVQAMADHAVIGDNATTDAFRGCLDLLHGRVKEVQQSMEWTNYRKTYGVSATAMPEAHKAFLAGWDAAQGASTGPGPLR